MTNSGAQPVTVLDEDRSWALLSRVSLGRLATSVHDQPDIFPVNFVVQRRTIVIRTAEGTKLSSAAVNHRVAFEADDHDVEKGWSVVVKGLARVVEGAEAIAEAERAQVLPWVGTAKRRYIRITPMEITGRQFAFGAAAETWLDAV
jgi:nitroimidazol reductase NimA-like FMN-containing flavoprotein (pyridoxamine 5'-phosphate oxidase superfamily)